MTTGASPETINLLRDAQEAEWVACQKDFWYFATLLQTEDEERGIRRPFPLHFAYLHDPVHKACEDNQFACILKSRRMLISLYYCARFLWKAKLCKEDEVFYGGYSAQEEELAEYQLYRISQLHRTLPQHIQDRNPLIKDNSLLKQFEVGSKIQGYALKRQGAQGHGFTEYLFDEAGLQETAASTYKGIRPGIGKGKLFIVGTPNGEEGTGEFFYNVWTCRNERYKEFVHIKLHTRLNPEHTDEWIAALEKSMQPWEVNQQIYCSFAVGAGDPVFPEFSFDHHVSRETLQFPERGTIYIGWDLGYNWPAAKFWMRNSADQWLCMREFCGHSIDFEVFCRQVLEKANFLYDREKYDEMHFVDPAAFQRYRTTSSLGAVSDAGTIRKIWTRGQWQQGQAVVKPGALRGGRAGYEGPRIKEMRPLFRLRDDGRYGVIYDPSCVVTIDGMAGLYIWDKQESCTPSKNRHSHPIDADQYVITAYNRMVNPDKHREPKKQRMLKRIGFRTGM